jgi:hydroxymethylglutaryl-CoA reductase (NADPH)
MKKVTNIINLLKQHKVKPHRYENFLKSRGNTMTNGMFYDCINLRRKQYNIKNLNFDNFNYKEIFNKNCENVIGYTRIPTGIIGPVKIDKIENLVPFSTTEGALISSISRGVKLLNESQNEIVVEDVGMTRSPIIKCPSITYLSNLKKWINKNFHEIKIKFDSQSNHISLQEITFLQEGLHLHIRFRATTGNAMGMNMIGKSTEHVLNILKKNFKLLDIVTLSGNTCTDKKTTSINWINGRGKRVIMESIISSKSLEQILKVTPDDIVNLNIQKNLIGSSLAGSIGGFNCNTANIIAGIFIATGQDCGQIGTSSASIVNFKAEKDKLIATLTMPSLEIGIIGGGTHIHDQKTNIDIICNGADNKIERFAKNIIYCVLGCELSLLASLNNNDLMKAHLSLNR